VAQPTPNQPPTNSQSNPNQPRAKGRQNNNIIGAIEGRIKKSFVSNKQFFSAGLT